MQLRGGVYFVENLPVTPFGKIIRRKVKDIAIDIYNRANKEQINVSEEN